MSVIEKIEWEPKYSVDIEDIDKMKPDPIAKSLKEMIDALIKRGYRTPIIYSRWGFLVNQGGEPFWLKNHLQ